MSKRALHPRYIYSKTPSDRHIRLLRVQLGSCGLRCKLLVRSLDTAPNFEAISYTWGNSAKQKCLSIGNRSLPVTRNAYEVLRDLASTKQSRLLWIDAICVNQDDDKDKSQQVRLMREIYRKAFRVIIWLGSPPDAGLAHTFFNQWSSQTARLAVPKFIDNHEAGWLAWRKLLDHPYWTRVWVVQEVVVARAALIYYGGKFWKWEHFARIVCSLLSEEKRTLLRKLNQLEGLTIPHLAGVEKVSMIDAIRRQYRKHHHNNITPLPKILMKFSTSQATIDKDRVFAFLGISTAAADNMLLPDYSKTDLEVFEAVACHSLRTKLPFVYFSAAGLANGIDPDAWPSWVPDLRNAPGVRLPFPLWDFGRYHASAKAKPTINILENEHSIEADAVLVDKIIMVAELESDLSQQEAAQLSQHGRFITESAMLDFFERELRRYKEAWRMANETPETYALYRQSRKEAFLRTLLCDMSDICFDEYCRVWTELINADYRDLKLRIRRFLYINDQSKKSADHGQPNIIGDGVDFVHQDLPDLTCHPLHLILSSFRRHFAITEKGYMALVVPGIQVGDVICVFSGAETPHALRRDKSSGSSERYRLVGDAYVHGWMDGHMFKASKHKMRTFVLI